MANKNDTPSETTGQRTVAEAPEVKAEAPAKDDSVVGRLTRAPYSEAPAPKYETPQDELDAQDPIKGATPGSQAAHDMQGPESSSIGERYVPGSANRVDPAVLDPFRTVPTVG
jgi:hypothetical protein